jgi:hypothetical protein
MAKAITKAHAERISGLIKQIFSADDIMRTHRPKKDDEHSKDRVREALEHSKNVRNMLNDEFGIIWHHENP